MNYEKALEQAILYIENHLGDPLTVEEVACHTGYSYYHLTRLFYALLGENVGGYIKKRRLSQTNGSLTLRWTMDLSPAKHSAGPLSLFIRQALSSTGKTAWTFSSAPSRRWISS